LQPRRSLLEAALKDTNGRKIDRFILDLVEIFGERPHEEFHHRVPKAKYYIPPEVIDRWNVHCCKLDLRLRSAGTLKEDGIHLQTICESL
jgi:hypothetical protein